MVFFPTEAPEIPDGEELVPVKLNAQPTRLKREVVIVGKNVDPTSAGWSHDSAFAVRPTSRPGISFRIGNEIIYYNTETLYATDGVCRMLGVSNKDPKGPQILLVEHLISACALLGLDNIEIELDKSCYGPLFSQRLTQKIGYGRPTYWIPVCGPGISGFINALRPHCEANGQVADVIRITRQAIHQMTEPFDGKYRGVGRVMQICPGDDEQLVITVASADQPDIRNCPVGIPFTICSRDDLIKHINARPIMRLDTKFKEWAIFFLNLSGSYALNHETYFKARPGMTVDEVVDRMYQIYKAGKNEHFVHTAIADFPAELRAQTQGKNVYGEIVVRNGTHGFRKNALGNLFVPENISEET